MAFGTKRSPAQQNAILNTNKKKPQTWCVEWNRDKLDG